MTVESAVRARILAISAVTALVATRVYKQKLPQSPTYPCVRVVLVGDPSEQHLRGPEGLIEARVQVDSYARVASGVDAYARAEQLASAIHGDGKGRNASGLFGWIGRIGSPGFDIRNVRAASRLPDYDPEELDLVRMSRDYFVRYVVA